MKSKKGSVNRMMKNGKIQAIEKTKCLPEDMAGTTEVCHNRIWYISKKKRKTGFGAAGMVMMALVLGACGKQDARPESRQNMGIPLAGVESSADGAGSVEDSAAGSLSTLDAMRTLEGGGQAGSAQQDLFTGGGSADSGLLQPTYIGSWKVTEYCYPSTPCGLSQLEVDVLIGSELVYAPESFTCNQRVIDSEEFGYEFSLYDSLAEFEQDFSVLVSDWFAEGDTGKVKSGYLTIEEGIFGDSFSYMEEQPDKMLIYYYGVVFLAVRE